MTEMRGGELIERTREGVAGTLLGPQVCVGAVATSVRPPGCVGIMACAEGNVDAEHR